MFIIMGWMFVLE